MLHLWGFDPIISFSACANFVVWQIADGMRPAPMMSFRPPPPVMGPLAQRIAPSGSQKNQTRPIVAVPRVIKSGPKP